MYAIQFNTALSQMRPKKKFTQLNLCFLVLIMSENAKIVKMLYKLCAGDEKNALVF